MDIASTRTVVLGSFAFLVFWVTATFPKCRALPIGRTAGAIAGAMLMVLFRVDSPDEAYASINLAILGLLFGTMLVSVYLQRADMFKYLSCALSYRCRGGKDLICRLSFLVAFSSALFTNDTCCVLFTEFILVYCQERGLPPEPFLLALATSANIGSSATPIGNPQNLVIAVQSKISFGKFLVGILPAMLVGITLNLGLLLAMYWTQLSDVKVLEDKCQEIDLPKLGSEDAQRQKSNHDIEQGKCQKFPVIEGSAEFKKIWSAGSDLDSTNASYSNPVLQSHNHSLSGCGVSSANHLDAMEHVKASFCPNRERSYSMQASMASAGGLADCAHTADSVAESRVAEQETRKTASLMSTTFCGSLSLLVQVACNDRKFQVWKGHLWKLLVYLVALGMLAALLAGLDLSWSTISAAIALIILDFEDAGPSLQKVSYSLLVFFSGMFITVDGFNRTGLPGKFWKVVEPHAGLNRASGTAVLTAVIILLSNVVSNVPTVLLLGGKVATSSTSTSSASESRAWLILAWASTVAGNLTLLGSAANLIVCEQARMAAKTPYDLSFWRHLKFGFPSTLLTVAAGLPLIRG